MEPMKSMLCLVCNHAFSWRIGPLDRACAQCGSLHTLKSGLWELAPRSKAASLPLSSAHIPRANGSRTSLMKLVPNFGVMTERQVRS
jgi:hypothetical protein